VPGRFETDLAILALAPVDGSTVELGVLEAPTKTG